MFSFKIDLVCMGVPAQNIVDSMLRSMGRIRPIAHKRIYPNPAIWEKLYEGDSRSLNSTFNKKGTSQCILGAITRSLLYTELTYSDYIAEMSKKGVAQIS